MKKAKKVATPTDVEQENVPRITNDTVAEHREQVLSGARRFIYPLSQSKHKVVIISSIIVVLVIAGSLLLSGLLLYRYQSTGNFAYQVSQVVPFPVAKINGNYVPYEDYLFEVRHTLYYYRNHGQEGVDIDSNEGEAVVQEIKRQALEKIKLDALAEMIADEHGISVSEQEINTEIEQIRSDSVGDERVLEDILQDFYNWEISDLRKTLRAQLIRQKLPAELDTETQKEAEAALQALVDGRPFDKVVNKYSDDQSSKQNDGVVGTISRTDTSLPPAFIEAAFSLEEGDISQLVRTPFAIHIIKVLDVQDEQRKVAHVLLQYFDVDEYLKDRLAEANVTDYITIRQAEN